MNSRRFIFWPMLGRLGFQSRPTVAYSSTLSSHPHTLPLGFLPPCLPMKAPQPPCGDIWLHEIKLDGFRVIARKNSLSAVTAGDPAGPSVLADSNSPTTTARHCHGNATGGAAIVESALGADTRRAGDISATAPATKSAHSGRNDRRPVCGGWNGFNDGSGSDTCAECERQNK
jgi:hypothetical protein